MTEICWAFYGACKLRDLLKIIFHEASNGSLALEQKSDANLLATEEKNLWFLKFFSSCCDQLVAQKWKQRQIAKKLKSIYVSLNQWAQLVSKYWTIHGGIAEFFFQSSESK